MPLCVHVHACVYGVAVCVLCRMWLGCVRPMKVQEEGQDGGAGHSAVPVHAVTISPADASLPRARGSAEMLLSRGSGFSPSLK